MAPVLVPSDGLGRTEVARVLGRETETVLKMEVMTGGVKAGAAEDLTGASVTIALVLLVTIGVEATDEVAAPAITLDDATTAKVELAGVAALVEEAGFKAPPPVAGDPEILPKVRSCGATSVPDAISSGPGIG
jgi:hypothetical protein